MQKIRKKKKVSDTTLRRAVVFTIVFIIFVAVFGIISLAVMFFGSSENSKEGEKSFVHSQDSAEKLNILLIGTDSYTKRESSAFVILQLDFKNKNIPVTAIPGEITVAAENKTTTLSGHMKYGGVNQAKSAVEALFNIKIDNCAITQLGSFENIIDNLGGITYVVPEPVVTGNEGGTTGISLESGKQGLTGVMAAELIKYTGWQHEDRRNTPAAGSLAAAALNQYLKSDYLEKSGITRFKSAYNNCRSDFALSDFIDLLPQLKALGDAAEPAAELRLRGNYNEDRTLFTASPDAIQIISERYNK